MFLPVLFLLLASLPDAAPPKPDLVLENGFVYTAPDVRPRRLSILIGDGKVLFRGRAREGEEAPGRGARRRPRRSVRLRRMGRRAPAPARARPGARRSRTCAALPDAGRRGPGDASRPPRACPRPPGPRAAAGTRISGRARSFPTRATLDRVLPDRPALARRVDGHAVWVNTAALRAAGIDAAHAGSRGRAHPAPAATARRRASSWTTRWIFSRRRCPRPPPADTERWLLAGAQACARVGLTEVQDASGYDAATIAALGRLAAAREAAHPRVRDGLAAARGALGLLREGRADRRRLGLPDRPRDQGRTPTARSGAAARRCSPTTRTSRASAACSSRRRRG